MFSENTNTGKNACATVIEALQFQGCDRPLIGADWPAVLAFCDRTHLTLPLARRRPDDLPPWVAQRLDKNLADNAERWRRMKIAYTEAANAFKASGLEFVVLKGFTHCPDYVPEPRLRPHHDIDLLFPPDQVLRARDVAVQLGYEPLGGFDRFPLDHLPRLIRKTGWEWRGDYFDPEIPISLELHFRLWDERTEGFGPTGLDQFWQRRRTRVVDGLEFPTLDAADGLGYAALHALRHLLRGDLRPSHIYELSWFLQYKTDPHFWNSWWELHDESLRRLEAICFGVAQAWFGCNLPDMARDEVERLREPIKRWLKEHAQAPLVGLFRPNKDELWLHLCLLDSFSAKVAVMRRRLLPLQPPGPVDAVHLPDDAIDWRIRIRMKWRYTRFALSRFAHHVRTVLPTTRSGLVWTYNGIGLTRQFWRFFTAALLYDFGLFVFFLLYNLYLLQLGFREKFLGLVSSAMLIGSISGSLPAALVVRRLGVRGAMLCCFGLVAALGALRAWVANPQALIGLAFLTGAASVMWAVLLLPAVASLTNERNRAIGFSLIFSSGIAIGIFGSAVGGYLPGWAARLHPGLPVAVQYREGLWIGCAIALLALWPASRLALGLARQEERVFQRPPAALIRFLAAAALWNLGTGMFNPFFNVFFAKLRMPVESIGLVFSVSRVVQVAGILIAPLIFKVTGMTRGISGMQFASAVALAALAGVSSPAPAAVLYSAYMVFQYMSEPGMYSYVMECVPPAQRSGASAMNFLVASSAQAIAAALAGALIQRLGYSPVLVAAAIMCVAAAALFRILVGARTQPAASGQSAGGGTV